VILFGAPHDLLAIDPGEKTGWAYFEDYVLQGCGLITLAKWVATFGTWLDQTASFHVIVEEPTIYPHSKARPADIMALQLKVGELKGRFEAAGCVVELVQPRTWKRQVPKSIHNDRTLKALTDDERRLAEGKRHDVLDAIGLGLWKLKRMK
jgi:hypothetical protein